MTIFLIVCAAIGGGILVLGATNSKRIFRTIRGRASLFSKRIEESNPMSNLQYQIDRATDKLMVAQKSVQKFAGWKNQIERQVEHNKIQIQSLRARAKYYIEQGDEDNSRQYFNQMKEYENILLDNEQQLNEANESYKSELEALKIASTEIQRAEAEGRRLGTKLQLTKAKAELQNLVNSTSARHVLNSGVRGNLSNATKLIQDKIDEAQGQIDVNSDLQIDVSKDIEADQQIQNAKYDDEFQNFYKELQGVKVIEKQKLELEHSDSKE